MAGGFFKALGRSTLRFLGTLVLVLIGGAIALRIVLGPEMFDPPEQVADDQLFTVLSQSDASLEGRARQEVTITYVAPTSADAAPVHDVLAREAARRLLTANDLDAITVTLAMNRSLATAPPLMIIRYAPDGLGWEGSQSWEWQRDAPAPPFPATAPDIFRAAQSYLDTTPAEDRSPAGIAAAVATATGVSEDEAVSVLRRAREVSEE